LLIETLIATLRTFNLAVIARLGATHHLMAIGCTVPGFLLRIGIE
jgi:hypothetical protein